MSGRRPNRTLLSTSYGIWSELLIVPDPGTKGGLSSSGRSVDSKFCWISHRTGNGLPVNLLNRMAPGNYIAAGGLGGMARWIFVKFDSEGR